MWTKGKNLVLVSDETGDDTYGLILNLKQREEDKKEFSKKHKEICVGVGRYEGTCGLQGGRTGGWLGLLRQIQARGDIHKTKFLGAPKVWELRTFQIWNL